MARTRRRKAIERARHEERVSDDRKSGIPPKASRGGRKGKDKKKNPLTWLRSTLEGVYDEIGNILIHYIISDDPPEVNRAPFREITERPPHLRRGGYRERPRFNLIETEPLTFEGDDFELPERRRFLNYDVLLESHGFYGCTYRFGLPPVEKVTAIRDLFDSVREDLISDSRNGGRYKGMIAIAEGTEYLTVYESKIFNQYYDQDLMTIQRKYLMDLITVMEESLDEYNDEKIDYLLDHDDDDDWDTDMVYRRIREKKITELMNE